MSTRFSEWSTLGHDTDDAGGHVRVRPRSASSIDAPDAADVAHYQHGLDQYGHDEYGHDEYGHDEYGQDVAGFGDPYDEYDPHLGLEDFADRADPAPHREAHRQQPMSRSGHAGRSSQYHDRAEPVNRRARRRPGPSAPDAAAFQRRRLGVLAVIVVGVLGGYWAISQRTGTNAVTSADATAAQAVSATTTPSLGSATSADAQSAVGASTDGTAAADATNLADVACTIDDFEVRPGAEGESVDCAQSALLAAGYDYVNSTGVYDDLTEVAVREFQQDYDLYVDGLLGKRTAIELGIWPGDESFITRTPEPAPGATDLWGVPLSPVASAGEDAPPLPENAGQGTGKRVVYDRAGQRVWAIDANENVVRSYLVSGSRFKNEVPGEHKVYSKTASALGWDLKADLPYMVRYTKTDIGHIGFHAIPSWRDSGEKLQTTDELGTKLSGGCTRQHLDDAKFMWQFANVGTRVIVL